MFGRSIAVYFGIFFLCSRSSFAGTREAFKYHVLEDRLGVLVSTILLSWPFCMQICWQQIL